MEVEKKIIDLDSFVVEMIKYIEYPDSCHLAHSLHMSKANKWLRDNYAIEIKIPKITKLMIREQALFEESDAEYKQYVSSVIKCLVETKDIVNTMIKFKDEYLKFEKDPYNYENNLAALENIKKKKERSYQQELDNEKSECKSRRIENSTKKNVGYYNRNVNNININHLNTRNQITKNRAFER